MFVHAFGRFGTAPAELQNPSGITGDEFGNLYVADYSNHRVQVFRSDGEYVGEFGSFGKQSGSFNNPASVAISGTGELYVVDKGNRRVQIFRVVREEVKSSSNDPS